MTCHADRLRQTDGPLVRYAVLELHLRIVGRLGRGVVCGGCGIRFPRSYWRDHRCKP